ncbi:MAG: hypothetical protein QOG42_194, partial [Solirubrobacteraceae bacterium]|nr:hypothetical protein [Solirubrobacteraceae bacterium]
MTLPIAADSRCGSEFRTRQLLKRERGVATFSGENAAGARVIIKTTSAATVTAAALRQVEREITLLQDVDVAMLAVPLEAGRQGQEAYVVRPYVE